MLSEKANSQELETAYRFIGSRRPELERASALIFSAFSGE
jgi:hypothetical protein